MAKASAATPEQQQQPGFQDSIMAQFSAAQLAYKSILTNFIKSHPNSYLSLLTLKNLGGQNPEPAEMEPLFNVLSKNIRQSALGQEFKAAIDVLKPTAIGSIAPEFTQADTSGKPIKLSSFRGKYVLIDFWASWCGPCRRENPNVVNAYQKYKDKNFTILGVSLDKTQGAWLNAIKDDNLTWTQVSDLKYWQNAAAALYGVRGIPQNFLIDPDGKIVGKNLRGQALEEKLEELLGKKI